MAWGTFYLSKIVYGHRPLIVTKQYINPIKMVVTCACGLCICWLLSDFFYTYRVNYTFEDFTLRTSFQHHKIKLQVQLQSINSLCNIVLIFLLTILFLFSLHFWQCDKLDYSMVKWRGVTLCNHLLLLFKTNIIKLNYFKPMNS